MIKIHYYSIERPYKEQTIVLTVRDIEEIINRKNKDKFACEPRVEICKEWNR